MPQRAVCMWLPLLVRTQKVARTGSFFHTYGLMRSLASTACVAESNGLSICDFSNLNTVTWRFNTQLVVTLLDIFVTHYYGRLENALQNLPTGDEAKVGPAQVIFVFGEQHSEFNECHRFKTKWYNEVLGFQHTWAKIGWQKLHETLERFSWYVRLLEGK